MVTDEERDYMYRAYAHDSEMRINLGIRRRLAPLCRQRPPQDRAAERRCCSRCPARRSSITATRSAWATISSSAIATACARPCNGARDRNAGFSQANPQRLILPVIIDPEYHYEAINVEAQQNNPNSLLWWTKRLIALRKQFQAFGRGTMESLTPSNHRVLAFVRQFETDTVLVVANLSRFPQYVELDLSKWKGMRPVELVGHTPFPAIGDLPYLLTLPGHAFYWFSIEPPPEAHGRDQARAEAYVPPVLSVRSAESFVVGEEQGALEELLPTFVASRRWFRYARLPRLGCPHRRSGGPGPQSLHRHRAVGIRRSRTRDYVLPLAVIPDGRALASHAVLASLRAPGLPDGEGMLVEATEEANRRACCSSAPPAGAFCRLRWRRGGQPIGGHRGAGDRAHQHQRLTRGRLGRVSTIVIC